MENIQPITKEDIEFIKSLHKVPKGLILFCVVATLIGFGLYFMADTVIFILFSIGLIAMFVAFFLFSKLFVRKEIIAGKKIVREGKVQEKEKIVDEFTDYFLLIEGIRYKVIDKIWNSVEVGDNVEFYLFYDSKVLFRIYTKQNVI